VRDDRFHVGRGERLAQELANGSGGEAAALPAWSDRVAELDGAVAGRAFEAAPPDASGGLHGLGSRRLVLSGPDRLTQ